MAILQNTKRAYYLDFNSGIKYRITHFWNAAFDIKSIINELEPTPLQPRSGRLYGMSTSFHLGPKEKHFLSYDMENHNIKLSATKHIVGLGTRLGKNGNLKVVSSLSYQSLNDTNQILGSIGVRIQERFFNTLLNFHYTTSGVPVEGASNDMIHSLGVGFTLGVFNDVTPPQIFVKVDRSIIYLYNDTHPNKDIHFNLSAKDDKSNIKLWHLVICATNKDLTPKNVVKSFSGKNLPPKVLLWQGRGTDRERLPKGIYTYRLIVADMSKNISKTEWQLIEIQ